MAKTLIDPNQVTAHIIRTTLAGEMPVYFHGPTPDFGDAMCVYQVLEPAVLSDNYPWEAVEFYVVINMFNRQRVKAFTDSNRVINAFLDAWRSHALVPTTGGGVYLSHVTVEQLPASENDNLVNDSQITRFDSEVKVIARRAQTPEHIN